MTSCYIRTLSPTWLSVQYKLRNWFGRLIIVNLYEVTHHTDGWVHMLSLLNETGVLRKSKREPRLKPCSSSGKALKSMHVDYCACIIVAMFQPPAKSVYVTVCSKRCIVVTSGFGCWSTNSMCKPTQSPENPGKKVEVVPHVSQLTHRESLIMWTKFRTCLWAFQKSSIRKGFRKCVQQALHGLLIQRGILLITCNPT